MFRDEAALEAVSSFLKPPPRAKELVDGAPPVLKGGLTKANAEAMMKKLEAEGARVVLKSASSFPRQPSRCH